jgi:hypothetical protein
VTEGPPGAPIYRRVTVNIQVDHIEFLRLREYEKDVSITYSIADSISLLALFDQARERGETFGVQASGGRFRPIDVAGA